MSRYYGTNRLPGPSICYLADNLPDWSIVGIVQLLVRNGYVVIAVYSARIIIQSRELFTRDAGSLRLFRTPPNIELSGNLVKDIQQIVHVGIRLWICPGQNGVFWRDVAYVRINFSIPAGLVNSAVSAPTYRSPLRPAAGPLLRRKD